MSGMETLCRISVATPVVWRLMRMVSSAYRAGELPGSGEADFLTRLRPEDVLGSQMVGCLYGIGLWMSPQTALWVVCGFAGVLLNWFALAALGRLANARLAGRVSIIPLRARNACSVPVNVQTISPADDHSGVAQLCQ